MNCTRWLFALASMLVCCATSALAQQGADKPLRIVVPAAAGGGADTLGRLLAQQLGQVLSQNVVVENRTGAGGNLAAEFVARSAKDGNTLLLADTAQLAINPALYKSIAIDPQRDFDPIARIASFPFVLVTGPGSGIKTVAELTSYARANPGKLAYASAGVGTPQHLGGEMLAQRANLSLVHVPYRGGAPALTDVVAGQIPVGFIGIPPTLPYLQKGALHALAVSSSKRSAVLPAVPTMAEAGIPGYEAEVWFALVAPSGVPEALLQRLEQAVGQVLGQAVFREKLASLGYEPGGSTRQELAQLIRTEAVKWQDLVRKSGATAN
jgi:tripartite-type tricarboxylate transporter receptor subunit TctC